MTFRKTGFALAAGIVIGSVILSAALPVVRADDGQPLPPLAVPPADPSGSSTRVQGGGSAGVVAQSGTGVGVGFNAATRVTKTTDDGDSHGVSVTVKGVAGATTPGASQLPNLSVSGRYFIGDEVPQPGMKSSMDYYVGGAFDRNTAMGKQWGANVYAGVGITSTTATSNGSRTIQLSAQAELGAERTGAFPAIPYLGARGNASYEQCLQLSKGSDRDQLCAAVGASAQIGLVQVGLDASASGEYRRVIASDSHDNKTIFFVGPEASASTLADVQGGHASGMVGVGLGIRAW